MKYKCKQAFKPQNKSDLKEVNDGVVFETEHDYKSESYARLYLESGDDDGGFVDVTEEELEAYFDRIA